MEVEKRRRAGRMKARIGKSRERPAAAAQGLSEKKRARLQLQRAARRPRAGGKQAQEDPGGRLFVTALARGLEVLGAFRAGEGPLGNQELARRTDIPKPTISRITHTLTQLGYLSYDSRLGTYELGGRMLTLSHAALSNVSIHKIARPLMQDLATAHNLHIALAVRDKLMMLNIDTCEGYGLVGLRLAPGSRIPMAITAIGKAYLAATGPEERERIQEEIRRQHGDEWPLIRRSIDAAVRDVAARGFCVSMGEWRKDINAVGAPIFAAGGEVAYALSFGGPAYLMSKEHLYDELGPALAAAARSISRALGGQSPS